MTMSDATATQGQHSGIVVPAIISVDDHVIEPPDLWQRWLPAKYRGRWPPGRKRTMGDGLREGHGTGVPLRVVGVSCGAVRTGHGLVAVRGSSQRHLDGECRRGVSRGHGESGSYPFLRHATWLLPGQGAARRHGSQPRRAFAVLSRPSLASAARPSSTPTTRTWLWPASGPITISWSTNGPANPEDG